MVSLHSKGRLEIRDKIYSKLYNLLFEISKDNFAKCFNFKVNILINFVIASFENRPKGCVNYYLKIKEFCFFREYRT